MTVVDVGTAVTIGVAVGGTWRALTRSGRPGAGTALALASAAAAATAAVLVRRDLALNR